MDIKRVTFTIILDTNGFTCEPPRPEGDEPRPIDQAAFLDRLTEEDKEIMRANPFFAQALLEPRAVEQYDLTTKSFQIEVEGTDEQIAGFICATFIRYGSQGLIHQDQDIMSIMEAHWHFDRDPQDVVDSGRYVILIPRAEEFDVELTTNNLEEFLSGMHMYPRDLYTGVDNGHTNPLEAIIFDCNNVDERARFLNNNFNDDEDDLQELPKPDLKEPKIFIRKPRGG